MALGLSAFVFAQSPANTPPLATASFPRKVDKINFPRAADFSKLPWTAAFDAFHKKLSVEYAFTEWRRIDWRELHRIYRARVAEAESRNDAAAFQLAIREYVFSIPDGHMEMRNPALGLRKAKIGGGYGFAVAPLDDGRVVAYIVSDDGPAGVAGVKVGAEIVSIGGRPASEAAHAVSPLWARTPVATLEHREEEQYRYVSRAPVGTKTDFSFRNPGENDLRTATLVAMDDNLDLLRRSEPRGAVAEKDKLLTHQILPSGFGYIAIFGETPRVIGPLRDVLKDMIQRRVPGLILDLRSNGGGQDKQAAEISSFFHTKKSFYEYAQFYNPGSGTFDILNGATLYIEPLKPHFAEPVIALIGPRTVSSGEGIALEIGRAPNGRTLGFSGTGGYFGMDGGLIKLPNGIEVGFPFGASLDESGRIQIDSNAEGIGGVEPQIRIPRTYENLLAVGRGEDVELKAAERELAKSAMR